MRLGLRLLLLVLLAAVPIFLVQIHHGLGDREEEQAEAATDALRVARLVAERQGRLIDRASHLLTIAAQFPEVRERDRLRCSARMAKLKSQFPEIEAIGAATSEGIVFCSGSPAKLLRIADRAYFRRAVTTKAFTAGGFLMGRADDGKGFGIAHPVLDAAGNVEAVVAMAFNLARLGESLAQTPLPPDASVAVLDHDGILLARIPEAPEWIGREVHGPFFMRALLTQREGIISGAGIDGADRIYGFADVAPGTGVFVTVGLPRAGIFDAANRSFWEETGMLAIIFVLAATAALIGGEFGIRRPIAQLQRTVVRMAGGDLSARPPAAGRGIPEIANLASGVAAMAKALQSREESLRVSEQRFRDVTESASDWIWETDAAHRFTFISDRVAELTGVRPDRVYGRRRDEILAEVVPPSELRAHLADLAAHRRFRGFSYWTETRAGRRCFSISGKPVFDAMGGFLGYRGTGADVTEHVRAEAALRESDERLRAALHASGTGTFRWDLRTHALEWDDNLARLLGLPPGDTAHHIDELVELVHPDDRDLVRTAVQSCARDGADLDLDFRVLRPDRSMRWLAGRGQTFPGNDDRPHYMTGACVDVTERKQAEERQMLLMAELDHRVKNTLATVQSIATQTLQTGEAVETFRGRLAALARAHSLLAQSRWNGAKLRDLIEEELAPYRAEAAGRIVLSGEDVLLTPMTAQTLTLTMHELTTNAAEHGALSTPEGCVEVAWAVTGAGKERRLRLRWVERGGPPVTPPVRRGFGLLLIEGSLGYELDGTVSLSFLPEGVRCEIDIPLKAAGPPALQRVSECRAVIAGERSRPAS